MLLAHKCLWGLVWLKQVGDSTDYQAPVHASTQQTVLKVAPAHAGGWRWCAQQNATMVGEATLTANYAKVCLIPWFCNENWNQILRNFWLIITKYSEFFSENDVFLKINFQIAREN